MLLIKKQNLNAWYVRVNAQLSEQNIAAENARQATASIQEENVYYVGKNVNYTLFTAATNAAIKAEVYLAHKEVMFQKSI